MPDMRETSARCKQGYDSEKAQAYRFDLRVNNIYGLSDTESKTITIVPDVAPIADFSVATQVLRNQNDNNYATITATNLSRSTDGDSIKDGHVLCL